MVRDILEHDVVIGGRHREGGSHDAGRFLMGCGDRLETRATPRLLYEVSDVPCRVRAQSSTFCYRYGLSKTAIMIIIIIFERKRRPRKEIGDRWRRREREKRKEE